MYMLPLVAILCCILYYSKMLQNFAYVFLMSMSVFVIVGIWTWTFMMCVVDHVVMSIVNQKNMLVGYHPLVFMV